MNYIKATVSDILVPGHSTVPIELHLWVKFGYFLNTLESSGNCFSDDCKHKANTLV